MNIITKFTIATEEGTDMIETLTRALAKEKFSSILKQGLLEDYIESHLNRKQLVAEMNDLSNQWLVVYADNDPAGYAKITSKGKRPKSLESKPVFRIADFAVLSKYPQFEVKKALFDKCLLICKHYEAVWINEYPSNPYLAFFESNGFVKQPEAYQLDEMSMPSVCLVFFNNTEKS